MSSSKKKVYYLEVCYSGNDEQAEYISESIDEEVKTFYYGDIDVGSYFDTEGLKLVENSNELGES